MTTPDSHTIRLTTGQGQDIVLPRGLSLEQALAKLPPQHPQPLAALVDNVLRELSYVPHKDASIVWLDYTSHLGSLIYKRSLIFLLSIAARRLYPAYRLHVLHSLDKGVYCELRGPAGRPPLDAAAWGALEREMAALVRQALPIAKIELEKWEAADFFCQKGLTEKGNLLQMASVSRVPVYTCCTESQFLYGPMVTNTAALGNFQIYGFDQGFVLAQPSAHDTGFLPNSPQEPRRLQAILKSYDDWGRLLGVETVSDINRSIDEGSYNDLVLIAESMQQRMLHAICDEIYGAFPTLRLLLIAGPSSSGKTTFTKRLGIEMRALGIHPIVISMDDYFIDREATPLDEEGNLDFESIETVDLPLFNQHLQQLIAGEQVALPLFDFKTGRRRPETRLCRMGAKDILLIEGIHALNPRLTQAIPAAQKRSVYLSCLTQLNLDPLMPISSSDNRQLRRMVRDFRSRNTTPEETILRWRLVRKGEDRNIFPFQEQADFYFNSSLIYEIPTLRPLVEPHLQKISPASPAFPEAQRLLDFLQYFLPAQPRCIPAHSILQEFLGGSCFE